MTIPQLLYRINLFTLMILPILGCATSNHTIPEFNKFIQKAKSGKPIVIAYLGGSITCGAITFPVTGTNAVNNYYDFATYIPEKDSWRALTYEWLRNQFEQKTGQFRQVNAAIGGTPSLLGAYRLEQDVLSENPDLVFVEFAVNDNGVATLTLNNPNLPHSILRTTKSIIERLRKTNPDVAVFMPLSPRRKLENSIHSRWSEILDLGHDQTLLSAESLKIPYVSLRKAFYGNSKKQQKKTYYDGQDTPGNYVHPAPFGHHAYAETVKKSLAKIFKTGSFDFKLPDSKKIIVKPFPSAPKLVLPESLVKYSKEWKIEIPETCDATILDGQPCLASSDKGALEYTFNGTAIALWFDNKSTGSLEIYVDGEKIGLYSNNIASKADFQGQFCPIKNALDDSRPHTLRLVPVSDAKNPHTKILLRAVAIDAGNKPHS